MKKILSLSVMAAVAAFGAAYKIPEQSLNSTALAGAYVSHTTAADSAYFNPANMAFLPEGYQLEGNLMGIYLSAIKNGTDGHKTETENFLLPQLHMVSDAFGNLRFGLSMTEPGGLAKRWNDAPESWSAKKFELKIIEVNPTVSYKITDTLAIGAGVRYIYTEGEIRLSASPKPSPDVKLEGDDSEWGYNLALSYKPLPELGLAATYRSNIDLDEEGDLTFLNGFAPMRIPVGYKMDAEVTVPLPATLSLAADYTFNGGDTTVEVVYERVYWSEYERLTIYAKGMPGGIYADKPKNWDDSNTFRIGVTHRVNNDLTVMLGYAYDESPIPDATLGYELPDSDANVFSAGLRYRVNDRLEVGLAYLYDMKKDRTVKMPENTNIYPYPSVEFTDASAQLISLGVGYRF